MTGMKKLAAICAVTAALTACGDSTRQQAESLLKQAGYDFEHGRYDMALASIDSLRKKYPDMVEVRRKALTLYQDISLKKAQEALEETDHMLREANTTYEMMKETVARKKAELKVTAEELNTLTLMRMRRDSLQTAFDTQCAKIKYIHRKQKEN